MLSTGGLQQTLMLVGEFDEDVFEAGSEWTNLGDGNTVFQELLAEIVEIEMVLDGRMDGLPEDGGAADAGNLAREAERACNFGRGDFNAHGALGLNVREFAERVGRPVRDELDVINVGDVAAAPGFVHVVRGDEERDAVPRKFEEEIPELAASDGVDPGSRLVEEKKFRLVQHGAAEGEALLPSAGKLRGQAIEIGFKPVELDNFVDAALEACRLEDVTAHAELAIFRDGQIVVKAEVLRHVTDALAD